MSNNQGLTQADEVPWFSEPPDAVLHWREESTEGYLHFYDPQGNKAVVLVMHEPAHYVKTYNSDGTEGEPRAIWQITVEGETATVRDSVHFAGHWHSPNPVKFHLVDKLKEEE